MNSLFEGKVVLITGGTAGIGRAALAAWTGKRTRVGVFGEPGVSIGHG
jgi:NAD(P)-dependent dehydrogenase (short-subunit alcohol dehydrogenase family)